MNQHTPGPWLALGERRIKKPTAYEHNRKSTIMATGHRVAIVDGPSNLDRHEEWEANARLIAAAPDLLEACKSALALIDIATGYKDMSTSKELKAAIAKAEERNS